MAFTFSHMVVAPVLYKLFRAKIPLASLAIGAMSPDLPRLVGHSGVFSHTFTGVLTIDLVVGLLACFIWYTIYRPVIYIWAHRYRCPLVSTTKLNFIFDCTLGILIGAFTHLIWDGLTHDDFRTFIGREFLAQNFELPWLNLSLSVHRALQYASSFLALPFLYYLYQPIHKAPKLKHTLCNHLLQRPLFNLVISCAAGFAYCSYQHYQFPLSWQHDFYHFIARSFFYFSLAFLLVFTGLCRILQTTFDKESENLTCDPTDNKA